MTDEFKQVDWYKSGQKEWQATYKDDKQHGRTTFWYENGQKEREEIWKDGELEE